MGSLRKVPRHQKICERFVGQLGELIVRSGHTLLTGCCSSLDKAIGESAYNCLKTRGKDDRVQLVSYVLKGAEPVFRHGTIKISALKDWDLTHPELVAPEQIASAHIAILIAGSQGTFIAANWARIVGLPVLGIPQFGGAGEHLYSSEYKRFQEKYAKSITLEEFEKLNQYSRNPSRLAQDVINVAEQIVMPRKVFAAMPFKSELEKLFISYQEVCQELGFEAVRSDKVETNERITQRIIDGIRTSAFVIGDVTKVRPNVFYEFGLAHGFEKQVVVTARTGTKLPFDIKDIPVIFWDGQEDLKKKLSKRIRATAASFTK